MHGIWFLKSPKIKTDKKKKGLCHILLPSIRHESITDQKIERKKKKKKSSITHDAAIDALDFVAIDAIKTKMAVIAFGDLRTHMSITTENY